MPKTAKNIFFSALAADTTHPFDGMAAGEFIDMYGRPTIIKREELAQYVVNTKRNIQATADPNGNVVGLPIDCMNHNHQEAAGWIVDVDLADGRDVILFTPRWNDLGRSLIGGDMMRMFSAEFDIRQKVIVGGTLTNWPATRNRNQEILIKPIALSQALSSISMDESLEETLMKIRKSFNEFTGSWYVYAVEVFDGYLICRDEDEDKLFKVEFSETADGLAFADRSEWTEVKQTYIETAMQMVKDVFNRLFSGKREVSDPVPDPVTQVEATMPVDLTKLTSEERTALVSQLASGSNPFPELANLVKTQATEMANAMLAAERRKQDTAALASRLVGGTTEAPRGLPVDKDQLAEFMLSLSPEQAEKATAFLSTIQEKGLVDYKETGHAGEVTGQLDLPAEYALALDRGDLTVADLSNPILALGDIAQYNLSKWQKEK